MFDPSPTPDLAALDPEDLAACRRLLRNGSRSFYMASFMLPGSFSEAATALYAFCRDTDDVIDAEDRPPDALEQLHRRLDDVYAGRPADSPVDRAFAVVVEAAGIPQALPEALLEGMAWDEAGREYETLSDVFAYSARVAASVGAMMSCVMGGRAPGTLARACDLGVAMQLSNIARDVGEDAGMERIYLPRAWLRDAGIDPEAWLRAPAHSEALGAIVSRLLDEAETLYARSTLGIADLPPSCRLGIHMASRVYAEIGAEVRRRGGDSVTARAIVSMPRKLAHLPPACAATFRRSAPCDDPPLEETRFLVEAVVDMPRTAVPFALSGDAGS